MHTELQSDDEETQQAGRSDETSTDQVHWTRYAIRNPREPKNGTRRTSRKIECTETRYHTRAERRQAKKKRRTRMRRRKKEKEGRGRRTAKDHRNSRVLLPTRMHLTKQEHNGEVIRSEESEIRGTDEDAEHSTTRRNEGDGGDCVLDRSSIRTVNERSSEGAEMQ
jgi:hypothetical protein